MKTLFRAVGLIIATIITACVVLICGGIAIIGVASFISSVVSGVALFIIAILAVIVFLIITAILIIIAVISVLLVVGTLLGAIFVPGFIIVEVVLSLIGYEVMVTGSKLSLKDRWSRKEAKPPSEEPGQQR